MPAKGSNKHMIMWLVAAVVCLSLSAGAGVFAYYYFRTPKNNNNAQKWFEGLPDTPPVALTAPVRDALLRMYAIKSNCWDFNNFIRVTLTNTLITAEKKGITLYKDPAALQSYIKSAQTKIAQALMKSFGKCPSNSWVTTDKGDRYSLFDYMKSNEFSNFIV